MLDVYVMTRPPGNALRNNLKLRLKYSYSIKLLQILCLGLLLGIFNKIVIASSL